MNPNRFCLLASLLGNHILPAYELSEFHSRLAPPTEAKQQQPQQKDQKEGKEQGNKPNSFDRVIKAVINYIRALPTVDDYDVIAKDVFSADQSDPRVSKLKESVRYYLQGTKEGYSKHFANPEKVKKTKSKASGGEGAVDGADIKLAGRVVTEGTIRLPAEQLAEEQRRRQQIKQQRKSSTTAGDGGKRSQAEIAERIGKSDYTGP